MRALILDCETTGLLVNMTVRDEHRPRLLEFYGAVFDLSGSEPVVIDEYDTLVRPLGTISETSKAAEVTGITNATLREAPSISEVMPRIKALIEVSPVAIAHNAGFDREVIDVEALRCQTDIRWPRMICTVEQTVHLKSRRLSLSELHEMLLGESFLGAHRARADVHALARCVAEMIRRDML
jgi:DNA polymerase III epsilon subunit-like protein